jgi:hypothetical protein
MMQTRKERKDAVTSVEKLYLTCAEAAASSHPE